MRIETPYSSLTGGQWLRGNLHAHTTKSDGQRSRQDVVDDYAKRGYDFLMISDHDIFTSAAEYAELNTHGMVMIPGNEVTANGTHLLHVNGNRRVEPHADRQQVIDDIARFGGFSVVNHPNWSWDDKEHAWAHAPQNKLREWRGYTGIEIYNGVIGRLCGSQYALDRWDRLLTAGGRAWGFANDDSHAATGDVALGWNVAYVRDRSVSGVVEALTAGRFYASTGVTINKIEVSGDTIRIATENADRIVATVGGQRRIAVIDASHIELKAPEKEPYVRFECWGRGEQFAWTQPFFLHAE